MATNNDVRQGLLTAGDVEILQAVVIAASGQEYDVRLFITELNIFEDMLRPGMYGNVVMVDAQNLASLVPIIGDEYLRLSFSTPTMGDDALISKTFKIYSVTDRMMISDTGKQTYTMHFCSPEMFIDLLSPIYSTFSGPIHEVVSKIYSDYISTSRNGGDELTSLIILSDAENEVKFTSPGWRPFHCINWLAGRAKGQNYKNPGYLFYESNKAYYFANVEAIIDLAIQGKAIYQYYTYTPRMLNPDQDAAQASPEYQRDIEADYRKVEDFRVIQSFNALKNTQNGYYANRLITLDMLTKQYNVYDYDHVASYNEYKHLENIRGTSNTDCAPFYENSLRSPAGMVHFYPQHSQLYTGFKNNVADRIKDTLPRRISTLNELTNQKIEITVPGRTDIEVGAIIGFIYPDASPRSEADKSEIPADDLYSGFYLVTAIRHKITLKKHMMILECVKDSLKRRPR